MKDAFLEDEAFLDVANALNGIFGTFRHSAKLVKLLRQTGDMIGCSTITWPRAEGTRFQNHKLKALKALLVNYLPFASLMETSIAANKELVKGGVLNKMRGWLMLFKSYKFLATSHFYHQTLIETANVSYMFQRKDLTVIEVKDVLTRCKARLAEISQETSEVGAPQQADLPFRACIEVDEEDAAQTTVTIR